jgi:hypothetical protein
MRYKTREFVFQGTYEMASLVESSVGWSDSFIEVWWDNPEVMQCIAECSKLSILHYYICATISVRKRQDYSGNEDFYDETDEARDEIEEALAAYGVDYVPYSEFLLTEADSKSGRSKFYHWFQSQSQSFELLWEKTTDEVFHWLFGNRAFLLRFNQSLSEYLQSGAVKIPSDYLDVKGVLRRQGSFPTWARKAIYYRDQGRCVLCQRDLSGLLSTDQRIHIDHMVPLNLWGTNDPCNLQLLCEDCNLRKSGTVAKTANRYHPWWDY